MKRCHLGATGFPGGAGSSDTDSNFVSSLKGRIIAFRPWRSERDGRYPPPNV